MAKDRAQAPQEAATDRVADTVNEFCDALRIGRSLFYNEVKANRIKILKAGRKTLVPRTEREAWLRRLAGEEGLMAPSAAPDMPCVSSISPDTEVVAKALGGREAATSRKRQQP